jgi:hypothetical protein
MSDQPRAVWLTREQRDVIGKLDASGYVPIRFLRVADEIVAAWDAAPADPGEAVREALEPYLPIDEDYPRAVAAAVLADLGFPALSEPRGDTDA